MADHPGPCGREALGPRARLLDQPRRLVAGTAAAARAVRRLVFRGAFRRMAAALVGRVRPALVGRHAEEGGRRQEGARRGLCTVRAILRRVAFGHRAHVGEGAASGAEIIVSRHDVVPCAVMPGASARHDGALQLLLVRPVLLILTWQQKALKKLQKLQA